MPSPSTNLVSPGVYSARVVNAERSVSKSNNPMIVLSIEVLPSQAPLKAWLVLSEVGRWRLIGFCDSANLLRSVHPDAPLTLEPEHCINRLCFVRVAHETFNGWLQAKVDRFLRRAAAVKENPALAEIPEQRPLKLPEASLQTTPADEPDDLF
jgi:hypothetical protein